MSNSVSFQSLDELKKKHGLGGDGRVQRYIDQEVVRLMAPFTPLDTGALQKGINAKNGEVVYSAPYAKMLYYGKVMVSPSTGSPWARRGEEKVLTQRSLQFNGAPMRGAYWFLRMKAQFAEEILKGAGKIHGN
ncbi:minor capsid protein [Anaerotignum sp. MB30-C6]|uniref:minor capsid protein n=1 Tax=Anaerotignum sp. MB30-C6 TaxID=3070814 RepID=UPI0027DDCB34|nr:minor capsid protein [Anaerotignum sp. MB30-C6]WMI80353.1 minor capsid protein [Anaerotignum sp. MB30-C6]